VEKTTVVACLALAALTACTRQKSISRDELQSKLRSAASIAAETATFFDYVRQRRATDQYARGHLEYLFSEVDRTAKELHESFAVRGAEPQFRDGIKEVDDLAAELRNVRTRLEHREEIDQEQAQIEAIGVRLQRTISTL
jgi:hypothetical protein